MAALKWTIERASREFNVAPVTLRKFLRQAGAESDETDCFSTAQIVQCLYGDLRAERLRKERELTRKYSLENAIVEASVLNRSELMKVMAAIADAFTSRVMSVTGLSRHEKEDLLKDLASWPLALQEVAHRQTRLPARGNRDRNGDGDESED
jgi:hypothetical protein